MKTRSSRTPWFLMFFGSLGLTGALPAQTIYPLKLNSNLAALGDVTQLQISPDGSRVVYRADQDTDGVDELYSVPIEGGVTTKLSGTLVTGGNVAFTFRISPDSSRVVYLADGDTDGMNELYSVASEGGAVAKLNGTLPAGGLVQSFQISADGSRVVYLAEQDADNLDELYSVPILGGLRSQLNGPLVAGGAVLDFKISPDDSRVVYRARQDTPGVNELYSVPLSGGAVTKLNGPLITGGDVYSDFRISSDNSTVAYRADQDTDGVIELYSVPMDGGMTVKLNSPLPALGDVDSEFRISPDGSCIVYRADQEINDVFELYCVPLAGGELPAKLSGSLVSGGDVQHNFEIGPNSNRVVYQADQDTDGVIELYSAPLEGGTTAKLNGPAVPGGDTLGGYQITSDGSRVVYRADLDIDNVYELFSAPIEGGTAVKLNGTIVTGGFVGHFRTSPDGSRVVYRADQDTDEVLELYSVPVGGGVVMKLNSALTTGGDAQALYQISPDTTRVAYLADQETDDVNELYSVPIGGGTVVELSGNLAARGGTGRFVVSSDGSRVVYPADQDTENVSELYSVAIEGGAPVKLNDDLVAGRHVNGFQVSLDGSWVVYRSDRDAEGVLELYSVPIQGGVPLKLNGPLVAGGGVDLDFQISPDSSRVVYRADQDTDEVSELYSVPLWGGEAVKLNGSVVTGGEVFSGFQISQDSSRVVYRGDLDTGNVLELYSVPLAGGTIVKLNGTFPATADVEPGFQISPNGSWVVFRADALTDWQYELYKVQIEGIALERLSGSLHADGDVGNFAISPDSSRVVFDADAENGLRRDLYSVRLAGGESPVKLHPPLASQWGFSGNDFVISPDSSRVVYVVDQDTRDVEELYSVPILGGATVKLNAPLTGEKDVYTGFQISPDGSRVVYFSDQKTDNVFELFSVPLLGGTAVKLNGDLVSGGAVWSNGSFQISPDSRHVVYRADQEINNLVELYRVPIGGGTAVKINAPLPPSGRVQVGVQLSPDSTWVVYRADQETRGIVELYAWRGQAIWETSGGSWFAGANWRNGVVPDLSLETVLARAAVVSIPGGVTPAEAESLFLGGADGLSVLELSDGAVLSLPQGAEIRAGGVLRGDGVVSVGVLPFALPAGAELRAGEGERFALQSGTVANAGSIQVSGRSSAPAEAEFAGTVTNLEGTGAVVGTEATLRFRRGLVNHGSLGFGSGLNEVWGEVENETGGLITVSGGGAAIFWDDVTNSSVINVSGSGGLQSTAVFFGALTGNGVSGSGHVFIEGDARPGFSPGTMAFGGDVSYGPKATLNIELAGAEANTDYDLMTVAGHLDLGGALQVALLDGFQPRAGMVFDVWKADSVTGQFSSVNLPELPAGLFWHSGELNTTGELRVALTPDRYADFVFFYGLTTPPGGDEEGDGRLNLFEYVTGNHPLIADSSGAPFQFGRIGEDDRVSFVLAQPAPSDAVVIVETSTTLQESGPGRWTMIASRTGNGPWSGSAPVTLTPAGRGLEQVRVTHHGEGEGKRFYRLRVRLE